ncbi:MAG: hypothetical protein CMI54_00740 [Parcubacteria group bacterium]|mgnify:CR=1 FL=1|jgi:hypothetical protein|nr:hypothetical protein [Parcubacteria group bacterium]|tara:strand:+ start:2170 stop:2577 length:408 start_codon:yes stop_codon:yes gene_type:complete
MANEAVIIQLLGNGGDPIRFTVADGAGIEKGTIMKISGDNTAAASTADGDLLVGIAAAEKVASDGSTTLAVYTNGIFDLTVDGTNTATLGYPQKADGTNLISDADDDTAEGMMEVIGYAMEAGSTNEVIAVRVLK